MHVKNKSRDTTVLLRQMTLDTRKRVKRHESSTRERISAYTTHAIPPANGRGHYN